MEENKIFEENDVFVEETQCKTSVKSKYKEELEPELKKLMDLFGKPDETSQAYDLSALYNNMDEFNRERLKASINQVSGKTMVIESNSNKLTIPATDDYQEFIHNVNKYTDPKTRYDIASKYVNLLNTAKEMNYRFRNDSEPITVEQICDSLDILLTQDDIMKIEYNYKHPDNPMVEKKKWYSKLWNKVKNIFKKNDR